jgi:hypothetical protein
VAYEKGETYLPKAGILVYIFLISRETDVRNNRYVNSCIKSVGFLKAYGREM